MWSESTVIIKKSSKTKKNTADFSLLNDNYLVDAVVNCPGGKLKYCNMQCLARLMSTGTLAMTGKGGDNASDKSTLLTPSTVTRTE